ncbi:MAG: GGDEF domain-containing protein [Variibacter sp.]|nr:GGDEF domain-containing protein [Variibacter sp.]
MRIRRPGDEADPAPGRFVTKQPERSPPGACEPPRPAAVLKRPLARAIDTAAILASVGEAAYVWDLRSDALTWTDNVAEVLKRDARQLASGRAFAQFLAPDNVSTPFDAVMRSGRLDDGAGIPYQIQYALRPPEGEPFWVEDTGRWFATADGRPATAHGVVRVVTERREQVQHLLYLSKFDQLTGEVNRWHLAELVASAVEDAIKFRASCAFLLIKVDNLDRINESFGFGIADEVVAAVAKRLRAKLRSGDVLGRFSGNKFGLLLRNCSLDEMNVAAERLLAEVRDEVVLTSTGPVAVTVTIGGVAAPRHARNAQEVLIRAQETLQGGRARRSGTFIPYRPSVELEALRRENVRATDEIVAALNERRILLAFEPVAHTATRTPAFYESLMRIQRADGSLASAATVIPIAERLGLVRMLDHRVLELVTAELAAAPALRLSVNVSPASTVNPDWWGSLGALLRAYPGAAERLTIEITEMAEIRDIDETRGFVSRVKDLGCSIAIDDFGAGFTSFRNLRKLGVDIIKIDGAFVQNLARAADDRAFVRNLLAMGRDLGLKTVAEWVQSDADAALLREWGCDYLQGELIGPASPARPWTLDRPRSAGAA